MPSPLSFSSATGRRDSKARRWTTRWEILGLWLFHVECYVRKKYNPSFGTLKSGGRLFVIAPRGLLTNAIWVGSTDRMTDTQAFHTAYSELGQKVCPFYFPSSSGLLHKSRKYSYDWLNGQIKFSLCFISAWIYCVKMFCDHICLFFKFFFFHVLEFKLN